MSIRVAGMLALLVATTAATCAAFPTQEAGRYEVGLVSVTRTRDFGDADDSPVRTVVTVYVQARSKEDASRIAEIARNATLVGAGEEAKFRRLSPAESPGGDELRRAVALSFLGPAEARTVDLGAELVSFERTNSYRVDFPLPLRDTVMRAAEDATIALTALRPALDARKRQIYQGQLEIQLPLDAALPAGEGELAWRNEAISLTATDGSTVKASSSTREYQYGTDQAGRTVLIGMKVSAWFPPLAPGARPKSLAYAFDRMRGLRVFPYRLVGVPLP
jgi:hypothetical protein